MPPFGKTSLLCLAVLGCIGCSRAPSIEIIGSFFPAWMFCIMAALVLTGLIRLALVRWKLEEMFAPLVVFYPSLAVAISCCIWFALFA